MVTCDQDQVTIKQGDTATVSAGISGNPAPSVIVQRNGTEMKADDRIHISSDTATAKLVIYGVTRDDEGTYTFLAQNTVGDAAVDVTVHVFGKLLIYFPFTFLS